MARRKSQFTFTRLPASQAIDGNGNVVPLGSIVTDFRGDTFTLTGTRLPHSPASTGRVIVKQGDMTMEYYPSVFGLTVVSPS